jgi:hypothetical protein
VYPRFCALLRACAGAPDRILFVSRDSFGGGSGASEGPVGGGGLIGIRLVVGFGSDCSEEPGRVRCDAGHAGFSVVLALSSRAHLL